MAFDFGANGSINKTLRETGVRVFAAVIHLMVACLFVVQAIAQEQRLFAPEVEVQKEDYAAVRSRFRTKLTRRGPAPQKAKPVPKPPKGVTEVEFQSGQLRLKAWLSSSPKGSVSKRPAVLFLHGGFAFEPPDWEMAKPYVNAGFVVLVPRLRGENGQPGSFSMFYDEVDDALAAGDYLSKLPSVDATRLFVAGHSSGGTLALLVAEASRQFQAAAAFDGSPDQQLLYNGSATKPGVHKEVVFNTKDLAELQVRSPLAYATSIKCPTRLYYSTQASVYFLHTSQRTAQVAKELGLDVEAIYVEGNHMSHVAPAMKQSIEFFRRISNGK